MTCDAFVVRGALSSVRDDEYATFAFEALSLIAAKQNRLGVQHVGAVWSERHIRANGTLRALNDDTVNRQSEHVDVWVVVRDDYAEVVWLLPRYSTEGKHSETYG